MCHQLHGSFHRFICAWFCLQTADTALESESIDQLQVKVDRVLQFHSAWSQNVAGGFNSSQKRSLDQFSNTFFTVCRFASSSQVSEKNIETMSKHVEACRSMSKHVEATLSYGCFWFPRPSRPFPVGHHSRNVPFQELLECLVLCIINDAQFESV